MASLFGILLSFYLEFAGPLKSIKPAIEAIIGRDFVTKEKLNNFEKIMSIFASIPAIGTINKIVKLSSKFVKFYRRPEKIMEIIINIYEGKDEIDLGKHLNESLRGMQDSISEFVDFIRYDDNLIAIIIRIILGFIYIILLPIIFLIIKICLYIYGLFLKKPKKRDDKEKDEGKENNNNDKSNKKEDINFNEFDEIMKKISSRGYNVRLMENLFFIYSQLFFYFLVNELDKKSKEKIIDLENEMTKKYKKDKKNREEKNDPAKLICDEKKFIKYNNEIYKIYIEDEKTKLKILNNCLKENTEKNNNSGFLEQLKGLFGNLSFLMKNNFGVSKKDKI